MHLVRHWRLGLVHRTNCANRSSKWQIKWHNLLVELGLSGILIITHLTVIANLRMISADHFSTVNLPDEDSAAVQNMNKFYCDVWVVSSCVGSCVNGYG